MVPDDVTGGYVGQHRDAQAAPAVLMHGDDGGGGGAAFGHDVEHEFDRWTDGDRAREDRVRRAHRLVGKALRHRDDRLRKHLGAFHHLTLVAARDAGVTGESVFLDIGYKTEGIIPLAEFQATGDSLKVGDRVTVVGYPAWDGARIASARTVILSDGRTVFAGSAVDGGPKP